MTWYGTGWELGGKLGKHAHLHCGGFGSPLLALFVGDLNHFFVHVPRFDCTNTKEISIHFCTLPFDPILACDCCNWEKTSSRILHMTDLEQVSLLCFVRIVHFVMLSVGCIGVGCLKDWRWACVRQPAVSLRNTETPLIFLSPFPAKDRPSLF